MRPTIQTSAPMTMTTGSKAAEVTSFLIDNFKAILDQLDVHPKTADKYKTDAKLFIDYVSDNGLNLNTLRQYKKHLAALQSIATKTKNYKLVAAKALLKELHTNYRLLAVDLSAGVKSFQVHQGHVRDGLNAEEVRKVKLFIDQVADQDKQIRLTALFYLLAYQGLRQFEICNLTAEDLLLYDDQLQVKGKRRDDKERIDLHPDTVKALQAYTDAFDIRSGYLFTSMSNRKADQLSERSLRRLFKDIFSAVGIEGRTVHGFRHYYVSTFLEATSGDVLTVMKFARLKSPNTVRFYDDRKRKKEMLPVYYAAFTA